MRPSSSASTPGTGLNAPIPPVLGPWSPSPMRLWSRAHPRSWRFLPSLMAKTESSSPSSRSWRTTRSPAPPSSRRRMSRSTAACDSAAVSHTNTPLPRARPSALTTQGSPRAAMKASASSAASKARDSGMGRPAARLTSAAQALLDSMRAAAAVGPKARMPDGRERVDETQGQRLVGPHDDEVGALLTTPGHDPCDVGCRQWQQRGELPDAAVARCGEELRRGAVAQDAPAQGVLTPAAADDEDALRRSCSRVRPRVQRPRGWRRACGEPRRPGSSAALIEREALMSRPRPWRSSPDRTDGLEIAALGADAGHEEGHVGTELAGAAQLGGVRGADDEHAVAIGVPLVADVACHDFPERLTVDEQVLELPGPGVARPAEHDARPCPRAPGTAAAPRRRGRGGG